MPFCPVLLFNTVQYMLFLFRTVNDDDKIALKL